MNVESAKSVPLESLIKLIKTEYTHNLGVIFILLSKRVKMLLVATAGAAGLLVGGVTAADAATTVTAQAGDTVTTIATRYDTTVTAFEQVNNINSATHLIYAGQTYTLPGTASTQTTTNVQPAAAQSTQTYTQPAQTTQAVAPQTHHYQASNRQASSYQAASTQVASAPSTSTSATYTSNASGGEAAAKAWIAQRESGGSYSATNGQYIGKYQLTSSYLNGDYSAANQEKVADQYVTSRYGSWSAAKAYWQANGSY